MFRNYVFQIYSASTDLENAPYWHVFSFCNSYFLKREYLEIVNPGVKIILQVLISVLFV